MLVADNIHKAYRRHATSVSVLRGVSLAVRAGEFLSVVGASGSGKSTFLHLLGALDEPDAGAVYLDGRRIDALPGRERNLLRNRTFGYVFQFYHLLPELSALDNVLMPAYVSQSVFGWWKSRAEWRRRAMHLLDRVGLGPRAKHKPRELSGGEMQRAAVARALLMTPRVLLADEPTGNLDAETGEAVVSLLRGLNRDDGVTVVMVTHNPDIARGTDRVVRMAGGKLADEPTPAPFHPACSPPPFDGPTCMASSQSTVDALLDRLAAAGPVTARKMFGEYCVYLDGKPVALVCDDQLFVKPTAAGREVMPDATEGPPFPRANPHLLVPPDRWDDRETLCELLRVTFDALPAPKPNKRK